MALISVTPDKSYLISEERLRFSLPADIPPERVPFAVYLSGELPAAIEVFEKHRGWKMLDAVPTRKEFSQGKPCCAEIMSKLPGESLTLKFMPSDFQGDTDDAHNFGETSDPHKRFYEENTIDWVAIIHFWVPAVVINMDKEKEQSKLLSYSSGFTPLEDLEPGLQKMLSERRNHA